MNVQKDEEHPYLESVGSANQFKPLEDNLVIFKKPRSISIL